jgi:hypothetical protein
VRGRVIAAKMLTALIAGFLRGVLAAGVAGGVGSIALAGRGVTVALTLNDVVQVLAGAGAAGALWAVVGCGRRRAHPGEEPAGLRLRRG